jgi:hypothetical protein
MRWLENERKTFARADRPVEAVLGLQGYERLRAAWPNSTATGQ